MYEKYYQISSNFFVLTKGKKKAYLLCTCTHICNEQAKKHTASPQDTLYGKSVSLRVTDNIQ